jgi:hypothetical protein
MAKDLQAIVRTILGAWITHNYDRILPYLADDVVYTVGEGAAKSICHTSGVFTGKAQVKLWYDSHTWVLNMYGQSVLNPLCFIPGPPDVITYEDASQSTVVAVGTVGLGVADELPCHWMSTWLFKNSLVSRMTLIADSVGGVDQFYAARRKQIATLQAAAEKKVKAAAKRTTPRRPARS